MTKILVYDTVNNYFEVFFRNENEPMPYSINNSLSVGEFCSKHPICWITKQTINSINKLSEIITRPYEITSAFHRIKERGFSNAPTHLAGIGIDIKLDTINEQLLTHRLLARDEVFTNMSDPDHTPYYLHMDNAYLEPASEFINFPTLRLNDTNTFVNVLQDALITLGYLNSEYITGTFDNLTMKMLMAFQRDFGLVSDGICGSNTWQTLSYIIKMGNRR